MTTLTLTQIPCADLHPDDVVLYRLHDSIAAPPLFEPGPDYEPVCPAVIVALVPHSAGGQNPVVYVPLWARVFRLRPEVREVRQRAVEDATRREMVLSVARMLFPGLDEDEWEIADWHPSNGWQGFHAEMGITLTERTDGVRSCVWGGLESSRATWRGTWAETRERVIDNLTTYLGFKRTREGTSARIVARRERAQALLAAMGVTP